jgi:hypothetical protein
MIIARPSNLDQGFYVFSFNSRFPRPQARLVCTTALECQRDRDVALDMSRVFGKTTSSSYEFNQTIPLAVDLG